MTHARRRVVTVFVIVMDTKLTLKLPVVLPNLTVSLAGATALSAPLSNGCSRKRDLAVLLQGNSNITMRPT